MESQPSVSTISRVLATSVGAHPRVASTGVALLAALVAAGSLIRPAAPHPFWLPASSGRWLAAPQGQVWLPLTMRPRVRADAPLGYAPTYLPAARGAAADAEAADGPSGVPAPETAPVAEPGPAPKPAPRPDRAPEPAPPAAHEPDPAPPAAHEPDPAPPAPHAPDTAPPAAHAPDPAPAPDPGPRTAPAPDPAPQPAPPAAPRPAASGGLADLGGSGGLPVPARGGQATTGLGAPGGGDVAHAPRGQLRVRSIRLSN